MDIPTGHDLNADQIAYWNGPGGQHWTERQQVQDTLLAPVSDILINRAKPRAGERIVDVGCGCGATTIAFAQKVGPTGHVYGIDVGSGAANRASGDAGRLRACGRNRISVRFSKLRSHGVAVRRDVLRRAG